MKLSVVLPVRNEADRIVLTLGRLKRSAPPDTLEVIVVDGGSQDGTGTIAAPLAEKVIGTRPGRAHQMHTGAQAASGDVVLFLHVDTVLPEGWFALLEDAWKQSPPPACTAFRVSFDHPGRVYRWIERATRWRFRWTSVPHGDQAVAVARSTYFEVGGFPDVPLMEEYLLARRLKGKGRVVLFPAPVVTSVRRYEKNGPIFNALRNVLLVFLFQLGVSPHRLAKLYR